MPLIEAGFFAKVGASLAAGIIKQAGARFAKKLRKSEREKALECCGVAAVTALVEEGQADDSTLPRDHLEGVLGQFAEDEVVHDILARAIREGDLPEADVAELREAFEEHHPPETLPGFAVGRGIAAFVAAFIDQADEESTLQGVIQTKELRRQTRYLHDGLAESRKQTEIQEEIRDRLPDLRGPIEAGRSKYLGKLRDECLMLPVTRLLGDEGLERPLTLDQVYIELDTKTPREKPEKWAEVRAHQGHWRGAEGDELLSAQDALGAGDCLVLLGDAGSGKSTFARAILAGLASSALNDGVEPPAGLDRDLVPVLIVCRELSGRLQELELADLSGEQRSRALADALRLRAVDDLGTKYQAEDFADGLGEALDQGRCILALDGLDEVPEALRGRVREAVLAVRERLRPRKILVTCRVRSYGGDFALPGFASHELAPLDENKIRAFCAAWYRAQGDLKRVEEGRIEDGGRHLAEQVLDDLLRKLAGNPLLLTTMAIIHIRDKALPDGRAQVYESAIQLVVRDWQKDKVGKELAQSEELQGLLWNDSILWPMLRRIAYEAHAASGTDREVAARLHEGQLLTLLKREFLGSAALAEEFLRYADQTAGILIGLGGVPGQPAAFSFLHRSFQEYLAGRYLTRGGSAVKKLYAHAAAGDLWSLAIELGAEALLHVDHNPEALLELAVGLGGAHPRGSAQWRRAVLWGAKMAALVGREAVERDRDGAVDGVAFLEMLRPRLVEILVSDLPPVERAEAGRALAGLGDYRDEVVSVDAMELCRVPAGRFLMGSREEDEGAFENEHPQHELDIPHQYWIGRYPVTWGQYLEFVEDGGYGEARFWGEAREHTVWADGRITGRYERERTTGPERYGDPWELPNHPIVGVSWYEAVAFCRWLTERWRRMGLLPAGWEVRLPSEAEWEKAARGGIKLPIHAELPRAKGGWQEVGEKASKLEPNRASDRAYPWIGDFGDGGANTAQSRIGSTSAVGCFQAGASPYGCEEMAGNVWEWTRSLWGEDSGKPDFGYPYDPADGREDLRASPEVRRVLRGGSFGDVAWVARCSARFRLFPVLRVGFIGFRLSLSPFSSDL